MRRERQLERFRYAEKDKRRKRERKRERKTVHYAVDPWRTRDGGFVLLDPLRAVEPLLRAWATSRSPDSGVAMAIVFSLLLHPRNRYSIRDFLIASKQRRDDENDTSRSARGSISRNLANAFIPRLANKEHTMKHPLLPLNSMKESRTERCRSATPLYGWTSGEHLELFNGSWGIMSTLKGTREAKPTVRNGFLIATLIDGIWSWWRVLRNCSGYTIWTAGSRVRVILGAICGIAPFQAARGDRRFSFPVLRVAT